MLIEASPNTKVDKSSFRVLADKLSGSFQFFQIEAFLLQPLADWLAVIRRHYQNHGLTLSKAGTGEKANGLSHLVFVRVRINDMAARMRNSLEFLRL